MQSADETHPLLERPSPPYTRATVRRAFIVWLHCGQRNRFRDVCNYYHYLEAMEDQLPPDSRASSRHLEFNLFASHPPISPYLVNNYPLLYSPPTIDNQFLNKLETIRRETRKPEFNWKNLDTASVGNENVKKQNVKDVLEQNKDVCSPNEEQNGATRREILEASHIIGKYCKENQIPLKNFLEGFKEYTAKCELKDTLLSVGFYIRRKIIHADLKDAITKKAKNVEAIEEATENAVSEKSQTLDKDSNTAKTRDLKSQMKLLSSVSKSMKNVQGSVDVIDNMRSLQLIDNDNKDTSKYLEPNHNPSSPIRLLKRNSNVNTKIPNAGFSNSHLVKLEVMKCRKI